MYDILSLGEMLLPELRKIAEKFEIPHKGLKKQDLAYKILDFQAVNPSKFKSVDTKATTKTKERSKDESKGDNSYGATEIESKKTPRRQRVAKDKNATSNNHNSNIDSNLKEVHNKENNKSF